MYKEILELYQWCVDSHIHCTLTPLYDGYIIRFADGSDIIQHAGSYGSKKGYVEPAGFSISYEPVTLEEARLLILKKLANPIL